MTGFEPRTFSVGSNRSTNTPQPLPNELGKFSPLYMQFLFLGANPNSEDLDSRTPLHSAIVKGSRYQPMSANRLTQDSKLLQQKLKIHNFLIASTMSMYKLCLIL